LDERRNASLKVEAPSCLALLSGAFIGNLLPKDGRLFPVRPDTVGKDQALGALKEDANRLDKLPFRKGYVAEAHKSTLLHHGCKRRGKESQGKGGKTRASQRANECGSSLTHAVGKGGVLTAYDSAFLPELIRSI
jgi:hypothetical protein